MCESSEMNEVATECASIDIKAEKKRFSRIGLSLLVYVLLTLVFQFLFGSILGTVFPGNITSGWSIWIVACIPQLCIGVPICMRMLRSLDTLPPKQSTIGGRKFFLYILMCVGMMYFGNLIGIILTNILSPLAGEGQQNPITYVITTSNIWANLLFAVLIVPFYEEWIFRKLLIDRMRRYGDKTAIVVSALLFALVHGNLNQLFYAFGLGLIFGYVYTQTGKLRYTIILHMLINFHGSVVSVMALESLSQGAFAFGAMQPQFPWGLIYVYAILGLSIAGFILLLVRRKRAIYAPGICELPRGQKARTIFVNVGILFFVIIHAGIILVLPFM